jgi:hypothetical protein
MAVYIQGKIKQATTLTWVRARERLGVGGPELQRV